MFCIVGKDARFIGDACRDFFAKHNIVWRNVTHGNLQILGADVRRNGLDRGISEQRTSTTNKGWGIFPDAQCAFKCVSAAIWRVYTWIQSLRMGPRNADWYGIRPHFPILRIL